VPCLIDGEILSPIDENGLFTDIPWIVIGIVGQPASHGILSKGVS
jgi:hypothetical protein